MPDRLETASPCNHVQDQDYRIYSGLYSIEDEGRRWDWACLYLGCSGHGQELRTPYGNAPELIRISLRRFAREMKEVPGPAASYWSGVYEGTVERTLTSPLRLRRDRLISDAEMVEPTRVVRTRYEDITQDVLAPAPERQEAQAVEAQAETRPVLEGLLRDEGVTFINATASTRPLRIFDDVNE